MEIISGKTMRMRDRFAIDELKIPSITLMENAAMAFFNEIKDLSDEFVIVASCGNNGGDGLAIARHLIINEKKVQVFIAGNESKMSKDCKINYEILKNLKADIIFLESIVDLQNFKDTIENKIVIDALFGTGLSRNIEGNFLRLINIINDFSRFIISVDIPSGLDADTGKILGAAIKADLTITFHRNKIGIEKADSQFVGKVLVKYIGIPVIE
ncbi:MAG: NAD(P)H-hydrate epimerase [Tissierellia bacterium]|nr:NAD(P)H-hydrate epimerase [Tissierellia bacterium]